MIEFMKKHNIPITKTITTKAILLSLIREANVPMQYIVN